MDRMQGALLEETPLLWKSIEDEIAMHAEDLGTWPAIAGIGEE